MTIIIDWASFGMGFVAAVVAFLALMGAMAIFIQSRF